MSTRFLRATARSLPSPFPFPGTPRRRIAASTLAGTLALLLVLGAGGTASAQVPGVLPFQARLVDGSGAPVAPGTPVVARLFTTAAGGAAVWGPETHTVTPVNGIVTLFLGDGDTPVPINTTDFTTGDRFLELVVGGETLAPRFRVGSAGYALRAASVAAGSVDATALATGAVTSTKIANDAVNAAQIATGAVAGSEIADGSITSAELGANSVGAAQIATDAVGASEIAADAVGSSEIATGAVGTSEILDGGISSVDLATNSVGAAAIAAGAVGSSELASGAVDASKMSDEAGVASISSGTDVALALGTPVNVVSRTINVPTSGYVVATATVNAELGHAPPIDDSEVLMSISLTSATHDNGNLVRFLLPFTATAGVYRASLSATDVFSVAAGSRTFYVVAESQDGLSNLIMDSNLNLIFVPTAYGTVTAAEPGRETALIGE